jgi:hypothetical protein
VLVADIVIIVKRYAAAAGGQAVMPLHRTPEAPAAENAVVSRCRHSN